jgi:hypothetical protein
MTISSLETIILKLSAQTGGKVKLSDLRAMVPMPKQKFDAAIIALAATGSFLHACTRPLASIDIQDRVNMVPTGNGGFYDAICPRHQEPLQEPPQAKQYSKKRGRHPIPAHLRRERVSGRFRLPAWLFSWLSEQENPGRVIEKALTEQHELTPPA